MGCGCGMTCWRRLRDWQAAGVWQTIWQVLLDELGMAEAIDWSTSRACLFRGQKKQESSPSQVVSEHSRNARKPIPKNSPRTPPKPPRNHPKHHQNTPISRYFPPKNQAPPKGPLKYPKTTQKTPKPTRKPPIVTQKTSRTMAIARTTGALYSTRPTLLKTSCRSEALCQRQGIL